MSLDMWNKEEEIPYFCPCDVKSKSIVNAEVVWREDKYT